MNNNVSGIDPNTGQQMNNNVSEVNPNAGQQMNNNYNNYNQPVKKSKNKIVKILAIIGGIVVGIIVLFIVIFSVVSLNSNKLVCESDEGNITIMYNDSTITGYTAVGISYDMDQQKIVANRIGINSYISQFTTWFKTNTTGTCTIKEK